MKTSAPEKVTTSILHQGPAGPEILLFKHPGAGIQIPAGTVEDNESQQISWLEFLMKYLGDNR